MSKKWYRKGKMDHMIDKHKNWNERQWTSSDKGNNISRPVDWFKRGQIWTSRLPEAGAKAVYWSSMSLLNCQDPLFQGHGSPCTANSWVFKSPREASGNRAAQSFSRGALTSEKANTTREERKILTEYTKPKRRQEEKERSLRHLGIVTPVFT